MSSLAAEVAAAVALFAGTNVDDVVVLALLSATSRAGGRPRRWEIWAGQYAGFALLVGLSLAAGRGLALIPPGWLWPLALIPIGLGLGYLVVAIRAVRRGERPAPPSAGGLVGVTGLTLAVGTDNVAAYTPFFATNGSGQIIIALAVFAVGVAVWCVAGWLLVRHERVVEAARRYGYWVLSAAFILIGLYTLSETGGFGWLH